MNPVVHFELPADDSSRMADFYRNIFGWQVQMLGPEMENYVLVNTTETGADMRPTSPGAINGGLFQRGEKSPTRYPSVVIGVEDIRASIDKVNEGGGKVLSEPHEIPGTGTIAYFEDTEGNVLSMLQPVME